MDFLTLAQRAYNKALKYPWRRRPGVNRGVVSNQKALFIDIAEK